MRHEDDVLTSPSFAFVAFVDEAGLGFAGMRDNGDADGTEGMNSDLVAVGFRGGALVMVVGVSRYVLAHMGRHKISRMNVSLPDADAKATRKIEENAMANSETPSRRRRFRTSSRNCLTLTQRTAESLDVKDGEGYSEKLVDAIEMIGEEKAAGFEAAGPSQVTPGCAICIQSRTIHQLVTDRNRAVGIYLAVASLLLTASGAILHASPHGRSDRAVIAEIQRWCLPMTFATLTGLALFMALLLIRTRVGLIYEVAKMNALLGLPMGRVQRISPLSIHFIMQALISLAGGASAALFTHLHDSPRTTPDAVHRAVWIGVIVCVIGAWVNGGARRRRTYTTSDQRRLVDRTADDRFQDRYPAINATHSLRFRTVERGVIAVTRTDVKS